MKENQGFIIGPFKRTSEDENDIFKKHDVFVRSLVKIYENRIQFSKADENYNKKNKEASLINRIKEDIDCADIIIADISGERANVLYELGLAHYLKSNKTVIITQDKSNLPTDLFSFPCFDYTDGDDTDKLHLEIESKIQNDNAKKITVGISEYPELMLIYYGIEKKYFKGFNIIIRVFKWNNLIDALNRDQVDVIISNKDLINKKNDTAFEYIFHKDLFSYSSFYLISRNNSELKSFSQLKEKMKKRDFEVLFATFNQFNNGNETIVMAAKETDHYNTFEKLNKYFGNNLIEKPIIFGEESPQELLSDFIDGTGDIYVGGIPERISLLKLQDRYKLIIDCNDIKRIVRDLKQKNVIIYKKEKIIGVPHFEKNIVKKFDSGWRKIFSDLKQLAKKADKDSKKEILKYISKYNSSVEKTLVIDVEDFINQYIKSNKLIIF